MEGVCFPSKRRLIGMVLVDISESDSMGNGHRSGEGKCGGRKVDGREGDSRVIEQWEKSLNKGKLVPLGPFGLSKSGEQRGQALTWQGKHSQILHRP